MPSRFPGIDPFLEDQCWSDFHHAFLGGLRDALVPHLVPHYVALIEERVYLEHLDVDEPRNLRSIQPDVTIATAVKTTPASGQPAATPLMVPLAMPEQVTDRFIEFVLVTGARSWPS